MAGAVGSGGLSHLRPVRLVGIGLQPHLGAVPGEETPSSSIPTACSIAKSDASNLVKIDIDGNKLDGSRHPVNKAGFTQHGYFHRHLNWAHAICHVHTTATMAVCSLEEGLMPINFYACNFAGRLAYHDFEGITVRAEEGERLLANLADKNILMLRNHGPVVLAPRSRRCSSSNGAFNAPAKSRWPRCRWGASRSWFPDVIAVHQRDLREARAAGRRGRRGRFQRLGAADRQDRSWRD
jgi:hypothetical protein